MGKLRFIALRIWVPLLARIQMVHAFLALTVAMRRRKRATEVWIGDSHCTSFNRKINYSEFLVGPEGQIILRIGPRLMWSLANKGHPERAHRLVNYVAKYGRPGAITPIFVSGEVDVRCHLVGREEDYGFVKQFIDNCIELATKMGSKRAIFVIPPPPSEYCPNVEEFPIKGSIQERVTVFRTMREAMLSAIESTPGAEAMDGTEGLAGADGALKRDFTDDGCHTNQHGVVVMRDLAHHMELTKFPVA